MASIHSMAVVRVLAVFHEYNSRQTAFTRVARENATVTARRFSSNEHLIGCSWEPTLSRTLVGPKAVVFSGNLPCFPYISATC